jgi:hypothetical protein
MTIRGEENIPAVADHAHALSFRFTVEFGALLEILPAPDALGIAKTSLGECVDVTPG